MEYIGSLIYQEIAGFMSGCYLSYSNKNSLRLQFNIYLNNPCCIWGIVVENISSYNIYDFSWKTAKPHEQICLIGLHFFIV